MKKKNEGGEEEIIRNKKKDIIKLWWTMDHSLCRKAEVLTPTTAYTPRIVCTKSSSYIMEATICAKYLELLY